MLSRQELCFTAGIPTFTHFPPPLHTIGTPQRPSQGEPDRKNPYWTAT
ncbi:hypothetical protein OF001_U10352 [Pseudomonas sp. OF001]|nr:hypothetical protein OF001_U10352 [Pseudomonas sp. OF001]